MKWILWWLMCAQLLGCAKILSKGVIAPPTQADQIVDVKEIKPENFDGLLLEMQKDKNGRNAGLMRLMGLSDLSCGNFVSHLYGRRAVTNVWYSNLTTATAAAAAIVGGRAAQNLSGVSAVSNQARSSINSEIYGGELIPNISGEISTLRKAKRDEIVANSAKTLAEYPAEQALSDVIQLHEICSIPVAMNSLLHKANTRSAPSLNVDKVVASLDDAIAKEQALLNELKPTATAAELGTIRRRMADLVEQRSLVVRLYAVPLPTDASVEAAE